MEKKQERNKIRSRLHSRRYAAKTQVLRKKRETFFRTNSDHDIHCLLNKTEIEPAKMPPRQVPEEILCLLLDDNGIRPKLLEALLSRLRRRLWESDDRPCDGAEVVGSSDLDEVGVVANGSRVDAVPADFGPSDG